MSNTEKVRERIRDILHRNNKEDAIELIFSDPDILVRAEKQALPKVPETPLWWSFIGTYQEGRLSLLRDGFVKVEDKEGK